MLISWSVWKCDHDINTDLEVIILQQLQTDGIRAREYYEDRWICRLQSCQPHGINLELHPYGKEMYACFQRVSPSTPIIRQNTSSSHWRRGFFDVILLQCNGIFYTLTVFCKFSTFENRLMMWQHVTKRFKNLVLHSYHIEEYKFISYRNRDQKFAKFSRKNFREYQF